MLDTTVEWRPDGASTPFVLDVAAYFEQVPDS
jgi:hypothetical protein